jgi:hypothetical protein
VCVCVLCCVVLCCVYCDVVFSLVDRCGGILMSLTGALSFGGISNETFCDL